MLEAAESQPPPRPEGSGGYADGNPSEPPLAPQESIESVEPPEGEAAPLQDGENAAQQEKGFLGKVSQRLQDSEKVQKATQFVMDKAKQVQESERYQKGVEYTKEKVKQIQESEKVQKAGEFVKDKAKQVQESERFQKSAEFVSEKAKKVAEVTKDYTQKLRDHGGKAWNAGRGTMQSVKEELSSVAWRGSARDTLGIEAKAEQWKDIKVSGAEEIDVPARKEHTCVYLVTKGSTLRWTFRVKERDLGFGVRMRIQEFGGAREEEVLPVERYDDSETVSGSWVADEDRQMVLVFDNSYSKMRSKTVAYMVGTERPPVFAEPSAEAEPSAPAADSASSATPATTEPCVTEVAAS